ncbi:PEP-CTERM sorting domain-containing protein [Verrucomicrobiaceae bacterium 227]
MLTDHDGDGLTDYEEMVLMQDPYTPNEFPRYKSPRELADEAKARGTTLLATAWETEVDRPILAGAVPEPSVLGLLGLSTLLSVTRRRGARC